MITQIIKTDPDNIDIPLLKKAADNLKKGGLTAFPTETVYGLGADAFNEEAVKNIYKAKGRPSDNPMIVHIADKKEIYLICSEVPESAELLMEQFSPGPITYILKKNKEINNTVTAGLDTVAVRIPSNKIARELIKLAETPVAAPSANLSGKPSPTKAQHVIDDMSGRIEYIIDGGECSIGLESTVVDMTGKFPVILRPGGITIEMIREYIPEAAVNTELKGETPKSPGMKYKHYAPNADVVVIEGTRGTIEKINELCLKNAGRRIGVILKEKTKTEIAADFILYAGKTNEEYASHMFDLLRECDKKNADIVFAEFDNSDGIGAAVKNRIYKASANNVIKL